MVNLVSFKEILKYGRAIKVGNIVYGLVNCHECMRVTSDTRISCCSVYQKSCNYI